jgi:hypothetical protein
MQYPVPDEATPKQPVSDAAAQQQPSFDVVAEQQTASDTVADEATNLRKHYKDSSNQPRIKLLSSTSL